MNFNGAIVRAGWRRRFVRAKALSEIDVCLRLKRPQHVGTRKGPNGFLNQINGKCLQVVIEIYCGGVV